MAVRGFAAATTAAVTGLFAATATLGAPLHVMPAGARALISPMATSWCLANIGIHCYAPNQILDAYNLNGLHGRGINGRGRTIVIVDSFGSPTIQNDLHVFDQEFGLPDPPNFTIRQDAGTPPPFDPTNSDMTGWATETTLDVEWAHVMAPGANILLDETPVSETEGVQGFPEIVQAENYVINHHLGDVISQSFGATEQTFPSAQSIFDLRSSFKNAAAHDVTVLGASGDAGATDYELDGSTLYPFRVNSWPSSDPLVTSVGGTQLNLDDSSNRLSPDVVWNDGFGAGGGGVSSVFSRPGFQHSVRNVVGTSRGTPDIGLSAAVDGAVWLYFSFEPTRVGYHLVGGTSEASPLFSGIVAMADQVAHQDLGNLNSAMYTIGSGHQGIVDVTSGNNSFAGVTGYDAGPGYDLASGLGTVNGARFVPALADQASGDGNAQ
jgi:subtilase family serine protease